MLSRPTNSWSWWIILILHSRVLSCWMLWWEQHVITKENPAMIPRQRSFLFISTKLLRGLPGLFLCPIICFLHWWRFHRTGRLHKIFNRMLLSMDVEYLKWQQTCCWRIHGSNETVCHCKNERVNVVGVCLQFRMLPWLPSQHMSPRHNYPRIDRERRQISIHTERSVDYTSTGACVSLHVRMSKNRWIEGKQVRFLLIICCSRAHSC